MWFILTALKEIFGKLYIIDALKGLFGKDSDK